MKNVFIKRIRNRIIKIQDTKSISCDVCGNHFKEQCDLKCHIDSAHREEWTCYSCSFQVTTAASLTNHCDISQTLQIPKEKYFLVMNVMMNSLPGIILWIIRRSLTILQSLVVRCFVLSNKPQDRPKSYHETNKSFNYQLLTTQLT